MNAITPPHRFSRLTKATALLGGIAAGLLVVWGLSGRRPAPPGVADTPCLLVSDSAGTLSAICIHYRRDFHAECIDTFVDLFGALGPETEIHVAVSDASEFRFLAHELEHYGIGGSHIMPLVTHLPITPWAKDRFGTFERDGMPVLGLPPAADGEHGPRANDHTVPLRLGSVRHDLQSFSLPFRFDGGDLLADDQTAFVAANFLARNPIPDARARQALLDEIAATLGRELLVIGDGPGEVPDHHIGMVLTPLGRRRVAVADPDLGLALWRASGDSPELDVQTDPSHYAPFHKVAEVLSAAGYRVVRIPMLLTRTPRVYVTYNNAIVETRDARLRIYMPVYGIEALDRAARRCFEAEQIEVIPVRVRKVYRHTGSLRCLVGIISRRPVGR